MQYLLFYINLNPVRNPLIFIQPQRLQMNIQQLIEPHQYLSLLSLFICRYLLNIVFFTNQRFPLVKLQLERNHRYNIIRRPSEANGHCLSYQIVLYHFPLSDRLTIRIHLVLHHQKFFKRFYNIVGSQTEKKPANYC